MGRMKRWHTAAVSDVMSSITITLSRYDANMNNDCHAFTDGKKG
jgi:hypothetical protein